VDSGQGKTHAVPVYEGFALPHGIIRIHICGEDLTQNMSKLLTENNPQYASSGTI